MLFLQTAVCEDGILGAEVNTENWLDHWIIIDGAIEGAAQFDSLTIEESSEGLTRARCNILNPATPIVEGKSFSIIWRGEKIFGGLIRTVTIDADPSEAVFQYSIEANGWDSLLARRTITASYANKTAGYILRDAITTSGVNADGVSAGIIAEGALLILVEADHVRMSDFIRDVGSAGGGNAYIDVNKKIQFQPGTTDTSIITVYNARAEKIQYIGELDNYRNRQIVKVTGTAGNTVTETRNDLVQQSLRTIDEGGSGIYEAYEQIKHPTSDVTGELSILGQTEGYLQLRTYSRNARRVVVTMREPAPRFGELVDVDLPGFGLSGTFFAMRKTWRQIGGQFLFEVEFWESSFQQLALESLLRIVGAGKAVVSISANVFPNVQLFSTPGSGFTWTVPAGVVAAQFTCYGGSGGGGGRWDYTTVTSPPLAFHCIIGAYGGKGGNSGKAVTITSTVPTTVYDIVVGGLGAGGSRGAQDNFCGQGGCCASTATDGGIGGLSSVKLSAATIAQGNGSGGGTHATGTTTSASPGADGADGGGIGDAVVVGGGVAGGTNNPASNGLNGYVEVRW